MYYIENEKLITSENYFTVNHFGTLLEICGKIPMSSVVECELIGLDYSYRFLLPYTSSTNEGNIFSNVFLLDDRTVSFIRKDPNTEFKFVVRVNNIVYDGMQKIRFSPNIVSNYNSQYNVLLKEITMLKQSIFASRSKNKIVPSTNASKGMVPIATGNKDEYIWDYIFGDIIEIVKNLSVLVNEIALSNEKLTEKVNNMDALLADHVYEEYNL